MRPQTADACEWDNETYEAEARSLPCIYAALVGSFPEHVPEYHEARIAAANRALAWAPSWLEALDMKGVALTKLRRFDEAKVVLSKRAEVDPDGYATHANLGTLYTFTGDFDRALEHIDRAMTIEPAAHFGREKYHRALVVYLKERPPNPAEAPKRDFLGLELTEEQRLEGSEARFAEAGLTDDAFDALVAMIAVYGAKRMPDVYLALGNALALRGHRRLAWTAYKRAEELGHPRRAELKRWLSALSFRIYREKYPSATGWKPGYGYLSMADIYPALRSEKAAATNYKLWEAVAVRRGLPVWTTAGVAELYRRQQELEPRCKVPGVIHGLPAVSSATPSGSAAPAASSAAPPASSAPDAKGP